MSIKITTLIEDKIDNSVNNSSNLICEHGLSFYIEKDDHYYLFDTGQTKKFMYNAEKLNVNLDLIEKVIISHGHYDHTGGLVEFLNNYGNNVELVVNRKMFVPKYKKDDSKFKFIGNNFDEATIKNKVTNVNFIKNNVQELCNGVYVTTNYKILNDIEKPSKRFFVKEEDKFIQDKFAEEVSIVIDSSEGLIVLVGCSHIGIINILMNIKKIFNKNIYAVMGGIHLINADDDKIQNTIKWLNNENIKQLFLSHCTGEKAEKEIGKSGCHTGKVLVFN